MSSASDQGDGYADEHRKAYEDLRQKYAHTAGDELKSGDWLLRLIRWILDAHAKRVDAEYLRKRYPGAGPANHAKKAIKLASRYAALVGGTSAAAVTALESSVLATIGLDAPLAVPAIGAAVLSDLSLTTRMQLRTTYDLSAIHGAPLSTDDVEDLQLIFATAMGIKLSEGAGDLAKAVGPKLVAFNVRRMLRSGLRQALVQIVKKIAGRAVARKLTEKALMRLLVPGINIPISAGMNYAFTRSILTGANKQMLRRGAVVGPLAQLHHRVPELPRDASVKALITVLEAPGRTDGWEEGQLDALRHTQSALRLDDDAVGRLDGWFDRTPDDVIAELPSMPEKGGEALVEYLATAAALGSQSEHDAVYGKAIGKIALATRAEFAPAAIAVIRKRLA
jgi:hypothetical protein